MNIKKSSFNESINYLIQQVLRVYYVPWMTLDTGDIAVDKTSPCFQITWILVVGYDQIKK